jgi:hypothetical protein
MVAAMREVPGSHIVCAAHSIQLAVRNALDASSEFTHLVNRARAIVAHFRQSPSDAAALATDVSRAGLRIKKRLPDSDTRSNSTLFLLQRLSELRTPVASILAARDPPALSNDEFELPDLLIPVLQRFDQATRRLEADNRPTLSLVLPLINRLTKSLTALPSGTEPAAIAAFMKQAHPTLRENFLSNAAYNTLIEHSSLFDLRVRYVVCDDKQAHAITTLRRISLSHHPQAAVTALPPPPQTHAAPAVVTTSGTPPPAAQAAAAQPQTAAAIESSFFFPPPPVNTAPGEEQTNKSMADGRIAPDDDPLVWSRNHEHEYPQLARTARHYLSIPATTAGAERLFSLARSFVDNKPARLAPASRGREARRDVSSMVCGS